MNKIKRFPIIESKKGKFPLYKQYNCEDFIIYVGGDAKSNDYLTFNMAQEDDIWLHAMGVPGSHVIIKVKESNYYQEKSLPTESVIRFAAELAKKNSKAPKEQPINVRFCQRRFVYKSPGMNDGQVSVDKQIEMDSTKKILI